MDQTILVKPGVVFREFNPYVIELLQALTVCAKRFGQTYTITSANDGKHGDGSYHYKNCALDIRLKDKTRGHWFVLQAALEVSLPEYFDILIENTDSPDNVHLHCEADLTKIADYLLGDSMDHPEGGK